LNKQHINKGVTHTFDKSIKQKVYKSLHKSKQIDQNG